MVAGARTEVGGVVCCYGCERHTCLKADEKCFFKREEAQRAGDRGSVLRP